MPKNYLKIPSVRDLKKNRSMIIRSNKGETSFNHRRTISFSCNNHEESAREKSHLIYTNEVFQNIFKKCQFTLMGGYLIIPL
jgi:hypothetical protein